MTITATPSQIVYAGDGVSTIFFIPFVFDTSADIKVVRTNAAGVPVELATGFAIAGGGGSTGTCTMTTAPAVNEFLTILDDPDLTQPVDYTNNDAFAAETHEAALDRCERQIKRLHQRVDRSIRVADGDLADGDELLLPISSARAGLFLSFDADGKPIVSSGTGGGDAALRTDLARTTAGTDGSRLSGYRRNATGSTARSTGSKLDDTFNGADFGMVADGVTNNSTFLQNAMNSAAGKGTLVIQGGGTYKCTTQVAIPSNLRMEIQAGASIEFTTDNTPLLKGSGVANVEIYGLGEVVGVQGTVDWPSPGSNAEGLIHFVNNGATNCSNIHIHGIAVRRTWCPISCIRVRELYVQDTKCSNFMRYGILASMSSDFHLDDNKVETSNVVGGNAYGIMATGDAAGGQTTERCTITRNRIKDIPAWDAIMSHDCKKLTIALNICENVRSGIDVGHLVSTNVVDDVKIVDNTITLTSTDSWAGVAAAHFGIGVVGFDATHRVTRATVTGNTVHNHGNMAGAPVMSGNPGPIVLMHADDVTAGMNTVTGVNNLPVSFAGYFISGTLNRLTITGGSVQGKMPAGGIRFSGATIDVCSISGIAVLQTAAADAAIAITGSTIAAFSHSGIVTNSTTPFVASTSTITYKGPSHYRVIVNQAIALLGAGASRQDTFAIAGITPGDVVTMTKPSTWPAGLNGSGAISGTGQVFTQLHNPTGAGISMAAADWYFEVKFYR